MKTDLQTQRTEAATRCPLCSGKRAIPLRSFPLYRIVRCSCGMVYSICPPDKLAPEEVYDSRYYTEEFDMFNEQWKGPFFKTRIPLIHSFKTGGKVLDVGCGVGSFFQFIDDHVWSCEGVELSTWAADYCRKQFGITVYEGALPGLQITNRYDLVTFWEVLEHVREPHEYIKAASNLLKNNGLLTLSVPNIRSLLLLSRGQHHLLPQYHSLYFSPVTLKRVLVECGFQVVLLKTFPAMGLSLLRKWQEPSPQSTSPAGPASEPIPLPDTSLHPKQIIKRGLMFLFNVMNAHDSLFCIARKNT